MTRPRAVRIPGRLDGLTIGHATSLDGSTGVTALLFGRAAPTVLDVRGGATATYDTTSLSLESTFGRRWAVFFAGGSVFGLDAAAGIREEVLRSGGGHPAFGNPHRVAPVSGAALYDLPRAEGGLPDYRKLGTDAGRAARAGAPRCGRLGAGAGATVGKYRGREHSSHGGVGWAEAAIPGRGALGVLAVVNSVGAVRDPETGTWRAGARGPDGTIEPPASAAVDEAPSDPGGGTTLLSIITDAPLERRALQRVAILAQTGLARCVVPANTATDGDVLFVTALSEGTALPERYPGETADTFGIAAAELVVRAVLSVFPAERRRPASRAR